MEDAIPNPPPIFNENNENQEKPGQQQQQVKTKRVRRRFNFETKLEVMKRIKKYHWAGLTYEEMQQQLQKDLGLKLSLSTIFSFLEKALADIYSEQDAKRIFLERYEKWKLAEAFAIQLLNEAKNSGKIGEKAKVLSSLISTFEKTEDFLSRYNIIAAKPVRQEIEVKPKLDIKDVIDEIIKEKENIIGGN